MDCDELLQLIDEASREGYKELDLSDHGIIELPSEIGRLSTLESLNLGHEPDANGEYNRLTGLPPEIGMLTALRSLDLNSNRLTTLPPEIGQLTALRSLDLSNNQLTTLPPEIGQLTALQSLDLSNNSLTGLPPEIGRLTILHRLLLHQNRLTALPVEIGQLTALQELSLSLGPLTDFSPVIGQLTALQCLALILYQPKPPLLLELLEQFISSVETVASAQRVFIPEDSLSRLESIKRSLNISSNLSREIDQPTVLPSPEIDSDDLPTFIEMIETTSRAQRTFIPEDSLARLESIRRNLNESSDLTRETDQPTVLLSPEIDSDDLPTSAESDLRLRTIHSQEALPTLMTLQTLLRESDQPSDLPVETDQPTVLPSPEIDSNDSTILTESDLRFKQLAVIFSEISQLTTLRILLLGGNQLEVLPPEIGQLTTLQRLILSDTNLTTLPQEIGQLTALTQLWFFDNKLEYLPPEIGQLAALQSLILAENELRVLPPEIGQLTALRVLFLTNTDLTTLPQEIGQLTALTELMLFGNKLEALPLEISQLTALQGLYLYESNIKTLPPEIGQLTALKRLLFSNSSVPAHLSGDSQMDSLLTQLQHFSLYKTSEPARLPEIGQLDTLLTQLRSVYPTETAQTALPAKIEPLTVLPPEIGRLTTLQSLVLSSDDLVTLPPEIGQLTALQFLAIKGTHLTALPPEIGQLTALQFLDLSSNDLMTLPPEIGRLTALTKLHLSLNQLTALPPEIGRLTALTDLILWDSKLTALPPEIGQLTALTDLMVKDSKLTTLPPEIGQLTGLWRLELDNNQLITLPPEIGQLTALTNLMVQNSKLTTLPPEIGQLTGLWRLELDNNQLITLPPEIGKLTDLRVLDLSSNYLTALPPEIGQLTGLWRLDLRNNQLTALPPEIGQLTSLWDLDLRDNPDFPLPPEILEKTDDAQTIIRAYLDYLAGQTRPLNEVKLVLVGEGSVGKTSIVNRLLHDTFDANSDKTGGIAIHRWEIDCQSSVVSNQQSSESASKIEDQKSKIRVNVWDFGGQEIMHATHQFFLTRRTLYVLVLDSRYSEAENRLDYWLTLIRSFGGDSPILVVGNKTDQHPLDLDRRGLPAKHPNVKDILETSCATGAGIPALREAIAQRIARMPHVADPLVTTWFDIKAELEALDADYIPYTDYIRICRKKNVDDPDSQRILLGFLHDLGIVLHFPDPRLETTNILNPQWVTQGVYRILNTPLLIKSKGILTWDMLARILGDETYVEKRMFIMDMMQKFELCYELPDQKNTFLVPDLLPKEGPNSHVPSYALAFEVHYSVLPSSVLTRLIVRMHRHIHVVDGVRIAWRTGVLLHCEGNKALVRADLVANRISIAIGGPGSGRRELLARIREHLEAIHTSFAGLEAAEKVPVPGHPEIEPVDYQWLRELERRGRQEITPPGLYDPISVQQLLDGVESPSARREREPRGGDTYYQFYHSQVGVAGDNADVDDGIHFGHQAVSESPDS